MSNTSETQEHIIFGYLHEHMAYISSTIGSYLKELYDNASEAHQHVILDMCANANVQKSKNTSKTAPWGSHSTSPNSTHPVLAVIMRALKNGVPLEEVDGYHEKVFNPDTLDTLKREVDTHHEWQKNHPYFEGLVFTHTQARNKSTPYNLEWSTEDVYGLRSYLSTVLLAPAHMAPIITLYCQKWKHDRDYPVEAYRGALEFEHQCELSSHQVIRGTYMEALALAHCPESVVSHWLHNDKVLTSDEYVLLAETMENMFPVRELAYQYVTTKKREHNYFVHAYWEYELATRKIDSVDEVGSGMVDLSLPTCVWLIDKMRETEGWGMSLETHESVF